MTDKPGGKFIKVKWTHSFPDEPALIYSELDENRWEVRKVEMFPDGHCGYASATESAGGTSLSLVPLPQLAEIAAEPEFEPAEIPRKEFDHVWTNRDGKRAGSGGDQEVCGKNR
jgi:hypothetical protein